MQTPSEKFASSVIEARRMGASDRQILRLSLVGLMDALELACEAVLYPEFDVNTAEFALNMEDAARALRETMRHIRHAEAGEPTP